MVERFRSISMEVLTTSGKRKDYELLCRVPTLIRTLAATNTDSDLAEWYDDFSHFSVIVDHLKRGTRMELAEVNGKPIGITVYQEQGNKIQSFFTAVLPEYRGKKIGYKLLLAQSRYLRKKGISRAEYILVSRASQLLFEKWAANPRQRIQHGKPTHALETIRIISNPENPGKKNAFVMVSVPRRLPAARRTKKRPATAASGVSRSQWQAGRTR